MPATLATLNAVTKEIYEGDVREQLNNEVTLLKRIEKTSKGVSSDVGGRYVTFPIHTRRNSGIGARNENEALPSAGQQGTAAVRVGLKYLYGAAELTGQAIKLIDTDTQAFQSAMEIEMDGLKNDLARDYNRQLFGDGKGTIATVTASGAATNTFTVDRPDLFDLGEQVDYVLANNTVSQSNRQVTAIDIDLGTVTISGATITPAVGDYFVRFGNQNREVTGLAAIVSNTGTIYNVDPTVEPVWKSRVNTQGGSSTPISEGVWTKMVDDVRVASGSIPSVILTSLGVRRAYANLLTAQRQFVNTKTFTGGFEGLAFVTDKGEIPVVTDIMAPKGTAYFLSEKNLKLYREADWSFMDEDGSKWQRKITSAGRFDAYESMMFQYCELGTDKRNAHGKVTNITEN